MVSIVSGSLGAKQAVAELSKPGPHPEIGRAHV